MVKIGIEIEDLKKGVTEIINDVADFISQRVNNTYCDYFLTTFDYKK